MIKEHIAKLLNRETDKLNDRITELKAELDEIKDVQDGGEYRKKFVCEVDGHKFYEYVDEIPNSRKIVMQINFSAMAYNIDPYSFTDFLHAQIGLFSAIKAGTKVDENATKGMEKAYDAIQRMNLSITGEPELRYALAFFVLGDEPDMYSDKFAQKKRDILNDNDEARAFFLCKVLELEKGLENLSTDSVLKYLHENQIKFNQNQQPISRIS